MTRIATTTLFIFISIALSAEQPSQAVLEYIDQYKEIAIREMIEYKIPASITMAQGILESGAGQSELARESNNHFGIKCHDDWKGDKVYYDDDAKGECFRKYDQVEDSYIDHSEFLSNNQRYAFLFELKSDDYKGWAKGLKQAGYATNPKYADLLIGTIEEYQLNELDKMSLADAKKHNKKPEKEEDKTAVKKTDTKSDAGKKTNKKTDKKNSDFSWGGYTEEVYYYNRIPTVNVQPGETPEAIAKKHNIKISLLRDYNDIEDGSALDSGTKCYLQPKRKKGSTKYHTVKTGETIWSISRDEGVRMSELYKYNGIQSGQEPAAGEQVYLRNRRRDSLKLQKVETQKTTPAKKTNEPLPETNQVKEKPTEPINKSAEEAIFIDDEIPANAVKETPESETLKNVNSTITPVAPSAQAPDKIPVYHSVVAKETLYGISKQFGVTVADLQLWNHITDNAISIGQQLIVGYK